MAGIVAAVAGGLLAPWLGAAPLTIKGPAAGLIVICLGAVHDLGGGDAQAGYRAALAATAVGGLLQMLGARLRAHRMADLVPRTVVKGFLAGIGWVVLGRQLLILLGRPVSGLTPMQSWMVLPEVLASPNPFTTLTGAVCLIILLGWPRAAGKRARWIPAPLLVLLAGPALAWLAVSWPETGEWLRFQPGMLLALPDNPLDSLARPSIAGVNPWIFARYVLLIAVIGAIETLLITRAMELMDPQRRRFDLDRDLFATGTVNVASALLGGLPVISEAVRGGAGVQAGARGRGANFFHGLFVAALVVLSPGLIRMLPLSALAALIALVCWRLAAPLEGWKIIRGHWDQAVPYLTTLVLTLAVDVLAGIAGGIAIKLAIMSGRHGAAAWRRPRVDASRGRNTLTIRAQGPVIFWNCRALLHAMEQGLNQATPLELDLTTAALDRSTRERLQELMAHAPPGSVIRWPSSPRPSLEGERR
ncbi:MAG: C4-dicarboxylic acid transporter DauA [Myxococcota bacterium]|nr:C4-dicarboxylic acid transporter DauA [Myxococcota bacterium]